MRRAVMAAIPLCLALGLIAASPEAAGQGPGQGRGGGGGTSCPQGPFTATLSFGEHSMGGQTIFATGPDPILNLTYGNVVGEVLNGLDFPVTFDLSDPSADNHYPALHPDLNDFTAVEVDPYISTGDVIDSSGADVDCDMLGMEADGTTPYTMRLSFRWYEDRTTGLPVTLDDPVSPQNQYFLRYKPFLPDAEQETWLNAVRVSADEWYLETRYNSIPAHFASLERGGYGKGKDKTPADYSRPMMPMSLTITANCGGACPVPN